MRKPGSLLARESMFIVESVNANSVCGARPFSTLKNVTLDWDALSSDSSGWPSFIDSVKRCLGHYVYQLLELALLDWGSTAHQQGAVSDSSEFAVVLLNKIIERRAGSLWNA